MAAVNLATATAYEKAYRSAASSTCVFSSYRLADRDVATAVATFLLQIAQCKVCCSETDATLKDAVAARDDEKLVTCIDAGLSSSTCLLGIISNKTKGSWWVAVWNPAAPAAASPAGYLPDGTPP